MNILSYKGYQGKFAYDPAEDIFHGEILHLADVITFQGRSIDELKQALADSIDDYIEFCALNGKTPQNRTQANSTSASLPNSTSASTPGQFTTGNLSICG